MKCGVCGAWQDEWGTWHTATPHRYLEWLEGEAAKENWEAIITLGYIRQLESRLDKENEA